LYKEQALIIDEDHDTVVLNVKKYSKSLNYDLGDKILSIESGEMIDCKASYINPIIKKVLFQQNKSYTVLGFNVWEHNTMLISTMLMDSNYVYPVCMNIRFVMQHFDLDPFFIKDAKGNNRFRSLIWE